VAEKRRIFISYQRQHAEEITKLVNVLEREAAFDVWYDAKIGAGKWWEQIIEHIVWADIVILALSKSYFDSEACRREYQWAKDTKRAILPVIVDPDLGYDAIPPDIREHQIEKYFGEADQFLTLRHNLNTIKLQSAPDPLPDPPEAPMDPAPPVAQAAARSQNVIIAGAALAILVIMVVAAIIILGGENNADATPTESTVEVLTNEDEGGAQPPDATAETGADAITENTALAPGPFDFELIFGGQEMLSLIVDADSHLADITLRTFDPVHETRLTEDFPSLLASGAVADEDLCLVYELEGTDIVRPLACADREVFVQPLQPADVFWFNTNSNRFADVVVYQSGERIRRCSSVNGSGTCEVTVDSIGGNADE
jgi:hypothetical protein